MKNRILFILKRREDYNAEKHSQLGLSTGLFNSASFMNQMLIDNNIESKLAVVIDNNGIDKEVTNYKPTHVIIEALWVVPSKFTILCKLHPNVKWIIRLHSEVPFLANEGHAMDWIGDYANYPNVLIGVNSPRTLEEIRFYLGLKNKEAMQRVIYLPNYYPQEYAYKKYDRNKETIDIACFGAIRPLKNHLIQAFAAIMFADKIGKKLNFHVNAGRIEMKGDSVLNNLVGLFSQLSENGHQLINHEWTQREQFLELCGQMDIGMQTSFSETFNIVAADLISQGVPLVGSKEIPWSNSIYSAHATKSTDIVRALMFTHYTPQLNVKTNQFLLNRYTNNTKKIWTAYFKK